MRVIWLWTWDLTDITYTVTPGAIYSVLEPTLGVVNACLPLIKPSMTKIFGNDLFESKAGMDISGDCGDSRVSKTDVDANERDENHGSFVRLAGNIPLSNAEANYHSYRDRARGEAIHVDGEWAHTGYSPV